MQTELSQILNQLLGLATQVEKLKTHQEQVSSHVQSASTYTESIERITRGTNLAMEGIARKTDDNHEYLRLLEQSVKQLRETQLNTSTLREGVHQLISDSFMRLQRYLEQRYPAGQPIDLGHVRAEAQHEVAANLLRKVEQILNRTGENGGYHQTSAPPTLQHHAVLLHQEIGTLAERQTKALHLLDKLRQDTPILRRLIFPVIEQKKREDLISDLAQLIKSSAQDKQHLGLADHLSHYINEVNALLNELKELRGQLLTVLTEARSTATSANDSISDLDSARLRMGTATMTQNHGNYDEDDDDVVVNDVDVVDDVDGIDEDDDDDKENFQVDEAEPLFKVEQP